MIAGYNAVVQTFLGTLFTWGLTAAGAALVFVFDGKQACIKMYKCFVYFSTCTILWHCSSRSFYETFYFSSEKCLMAVWVLLQG